MKYIIAFLTLTVSTCAFAQVAIGKASISNIPATTTPNTSISLEFGDYVAGQGKGIIVPWVTSAAAVTGAEQGTVVFDTADKIMKYRKADGSWFNLTKNETTTVDGQANYDTTGYIAPAKLDLQDTNNGVTLTDKPTAKAAIGTPTDTPGILVLEESNKAMVLPKVPSPHLNIINPEPGMMVYDTTTKQLAVFNGKVWSFWKP